MTCMDSGWLRVTNLNMGDYLMFSLLLSTCFFVLTRPGRVEGVLLILFSLFYYFTDICKSRACPYRLQVKTQIWALTSQEDLIREGETGNYAAGHTLSHLSYHRFSLFTLFLFFCLCVIYGIFFLLLLALTGLIRIIDATAMAWGWDQYRVAAVHQAVSRSTELCLFCKHLSTPRWGIPYC